MNRPGCISIPANLVFLITIGRWERHIRLPAIQRRVLRLAALGCDDAQVASVLGRSVEVVQRQKARAIKRLDAPGRRNLIRWAIEHGLLDPGDQLSPAERHALSSSPASGRRKAARPRPER